MADRLTMQSKTPKALFMALDFSLGNPKDHTVQLMYNPTELAVSRSIEWKAVDSKGVGVPPREFVRSDGRTLTMKLFIDTYESGEDASAKVDELENLTLPDPRNVGGDSRPDPPRVKFVWENVSFTAVFKSFNVTYTLFHADGRPARANINVTLQEVPAPNARTNPTSGGGRGRRSRRVLPGETLDYVAYQELGDARHWRHLADINGLRNPRRLVAGQWLVITDPEASP